MEVIGTIATAGIALATLIRLAMEIRDRLIDQAKQKKAKQNEK